MSENRTTPPSLRILPLLLVLAMPAAAQAQDAPPRLPPPRPDIEAVPQVPPAPVRAPATAGDPAPVHEADEDEADEDEAGEDEAEAEGAGEDEAAEEAPPGEDAEVVEGDDEAVLAEEALEAAAALRRPSFDEAETRLCEQRLRELGAQFEVIEPIGEDETHCGAPRGIALSSVAGIAVEPAVTVRCETGLAFAEWAGKVVAPMARLYLDAEPSVIGTSGSYECRWRRGGTDDAAFSQHAFANAIDVASVSFAGREPLQIRPPEENANEERLFQAAIRGGACAYFTTVLGPMTNEAHADHLHFDMAERRGGFRLCE